MPSLLESLKNAGVTIPDGVNVVELAEQSDEIKGLATAKNDLHQWKLENKPVLDELQAKQAELSAQAQAALEEKEKLAIQNKDYEALAQINADKLAKFESQLKASQEKAKQSAHEAALQSVASMFNDLALGQDIAATKVFTEINEVGEPVTSFKLGNETFNTAQELSAAMAKIPSYASHMPVGGGNNAPEVNGNKGGQGGEHKPKPKLSNATQGYLASLQQ